jgi:hypothetical protein
MMNVAKFTRPLNFIRGIDPDAASVVFRNKGMMSHVTSRRTELLAWREANPKTMMLNKIMKEQRARVAMGLPAVPENSSGNIIGTLQKMLRERNLGR